MLVRSDSSAWRIEISKLKTIKNNIRTDMITLGYYCSKSHLGTGMNAIESRIKHADRVRFNSLAHILRAPINSIPLLLYDSTLGWPKLFPRTV
ncbi:hypothetical protein N7540_001026 [Penicillium herquei]|nr:hypothetical protein N7540_001026 [Penicillium herquei]